MRRFLTLLLCVASAAAQPKPSWTNRSITINNANSYGGPNMSGNGWLYLGYDDVHQCTIVMANNSSSIYSNSIFCVHATTGVTDFAWTTGSFASGLANHEACPNNVGGAWPYGNPSDRHPVGQIYKDPIRYQFVQYGGPCNSGQPNGIDGQYMWRANLNIASIFSWAWSGLQPTSYTNSDGWTAYLPSWGTDGAGGPNYAVITFSAGAFMQDFDAALSYGYDGSAGTHGLWVFCPSNGGSLTAAQSSVGCTAPNKWQNIVQSGSFPANSGFPTVLYIRPLKKVLMLAQTGTSLQKTFLYDPVAKTASRLTVTAEPPTNTSESTSMNSQPGAYVSALNLVYVHSPNSPAHDWTWSPITMDWTDLGANGGSTSTSTMTWDESARALVTYSKGSAAMTVGTISIPSAVSVPLYIQESIYPGSMSGITRTSDPATFGIPLPDDDVNGAYDTSVLGITNASSGQFRILGRWPSGRIKWVLVDTLASLTAGTTHTSYTLNSSGYGNFGGLALATDNGSTITVATGAATFTVKKANWNGLDVVDVGATHVVLTGTSTGLALWGPSVPGSYPDNVTCSTDGSNHAGTSSTCTTIYSSANDASSTCSIEENGPVKATLKCMGSLIDGAAHTYMKYTARLYFYAGKTAVRITPTLRNADYGTNNTFATAFKGHQGLEYRLSPNLTGTLTFSFAAPTTGTGCSSGVCTGTLDQTGGSDYAYLYQAESNNLKSSGWCSFFGCIPYTSLSGYALIKNGTAVTTGTASQYPQGWADISNSSGVGVQIGQYQLAAYGNKSLEFRGGGTDVRVGIWAQENNTTSTSTLTANAPYYQSWPQWKINPDIYLNFHASAPSSLPNEFLKLQHYLVGHAAYTQYNSAKVFPQSTTTIIDPAVEDAYMQAVGAAAVPAISSSKWCCVQDLGTVDTNNFPLYMWRLYSWPDPAGSNQQDFRWSDLLNFIQRGFPGRFLYAESFYRMQAGETYPLSDGFDWRQKSASERDESGQPKATSANSSLALRNWHEQSHQHTYGIRDYYYMSGDETIKEAALDGLTDYFGQAPADIYQNGGNQGFTSCTVSTSGTTVTLSSCSGSRTFSTAVWKGQGVNIAGSAYLVASVTDSTHLTLTTSAGTQSNVKLVLGAGLWSSRDVGGELLGTARLSQWLLDQGDSANAAAVLAQGTNNYTIQVKSDLCVAGQPGGCDYAGAGTGWSSQGVSRSRGLHWGGTGGENASSWCSLPNGPFRRSATFMAGILVQGLLEFREAKGSSWTDYNQALDFALGISKWAMNEMYVDGGNGRWDNSGFRYKDAIDVATACSESDFQPGAQQTVHGLFTAQWLAEGALTSGWEPKFRTNIQYLQAALGLNTSDFGTYQVQKVISILASPGTASLQPVTITSFVDNGGGSYTVGWPVPAGAQSYRVKWGALSIVDWIGFNNVTFAFTGNPSTTQNWFASSDVSGSPTCTSTCSITATGLPAGLVQSNFSVKALATGSAPVTLPRLQFKGSATVKGRIITK